MFNALASDSDDEDCSPVLGDDQIHRIDVREETNMMQTNNVAEDGWETQGHAKKRSIKYDLELHGIAHVAATENTALDDMTYHGQFTARKIGALCEINVVDRSPKQLIYANPTIIKREAPLPFPFDCIPYMAPFQKVGADNTPRDMVISRGCMKDIMRAFEVNRNNPHLKDFSYRVEYDSNHEHLHIFDTHPYSTDPEFGYGFESAMTTKPDPDVNLYRCLSYTLGADDEKKVKVLLHFEVDCVTKNQRNNTEESVELKTHKSWYETPLVDYWYQMVLGDTPHLVYARLEGNGNVVDIHHRRISEIAPADANTRLNQLAHTLHWIKTTMASHNKATLSMKKNETHMTLKILE